MRLDPNPLFRRAIIPWYDSTALCAVLIVAMVVLVIFSITGIMVARSNPAYHGFIWVPWVLLVFSLVTALSISWRLIQRWNPPEEEEE
jgi:membrane protein implicated in regulation of membrane protease activity